MMTNSLCEIWAGISGKKRKPWFMTEWFKKKQLQAMISPQLSGRFQAPNPIAQ